MIVQAHTTHERAVRIGCGAGFWGDSPQGPVQLIRSGEIDYLILDYLAEITMSILSRMRAKDPATGYASDFPELIAAQAAEIKARGIRVVTNAGGVNPRACAALIREKLLALDIPLTVGVVEGDDLMGQIEQLQTIPEMFNGAPFPAKPWSANAYLGAFPIVQALDAGADIVVTGRCVDSALALAPLIHAFKWTAADYDLLAAGSLAGHVLECGAQATGGIITDWETVADGWDNMGFPIAHCFADGRFIVTKPSGTAGAVTVQSVTEQIVYEIGDPAAYVLPDVVCDFSHINVRQISDNRIEVTGARGKAPTADYKVSVTYQDGFRSTGTMMIGGQQAVAKAHAVAQAILKRTRRLFAEKNLGDYVRSDIEVLGAESQYGANSRAQQAREVILKLSVHHANKQALDIFSKEFLPSATSMAQGITGFSGGRPSVTPLVRLFSCLVSKASVRPQVFMQDTPLPTADDSAVKAGAAHTTHLESDTATASGSTISAAQVSMPTVSTAVSAGTVVTTGMVSVPLSQLAYARSGDKGNKANIGVLARKPAYCSVLQQGLTAQAVKDYLAHFVEGSVERFEWPGLSGFNFLLHEALGGGGVASLRYDPQGKMLAQILMDLPVAVPADIAAQLT